MKRTPRKLPLVPSYASFSSKNLLRYSDGAIYEGELSRGVPHGDGTITYPDGLQLTGKFKNGKPAPPSSPFLLVTPFGSVFEGMLDPSYQREGWGREVWEDGAVYEGQWSQGEINGLGRYSYQNTFYDGEWKQGSPHGWGTFESPDETYQGMWKHGLYHGNGNCTLNHNNVVSWNYEGNFSYGCRDGYGVCTMYKTIYKGQWKNDQKEGFGIFEKSDGNSIEGIWKQNELIQETNIDEI